MTIRERAELFCRLHGLSEFTDVVVEAFEVIEHEAKLKGYKNSLRDNAWWKDGVQYVGCGVKTLKIALIEADSKVIP